jgi:hypothetical protein
MILRKGGPMLTARSKSFHRVIRSVAILAASVFVLFPLPGHGEDSKRKLPAGYSDKRGASGDGHEAALLKAGWYYSWYIDPYSKPTDAEFVPMIAHGKDANSWYYDRIMALKARGKIKCLLGFNEPDRKAPEGGDISPEAAVNAWPLLEKTGLRLGSPAVAFDDTGKKWLEDFMKAAKAKNRRIDFIAVHWYGDVADPHAAKKFADWLNALHAKYDKPIWITEFAGLNWDWLHHPITTEQNMKFLRDLEPQMESTAWIERYCWFSSKPADLYSDTKRTALTRLGEIYRDGGQ